MALGVRKQAASLLWLTPWTLGASLAQVDDCGHPRDGSGRFGPNSPETPYNLGLYQAAAKEARGVAYELGYPLQGLKNKPASVEIRD